MATVSTYLNFNRQTEEAFNFYRTVFRSEFVGQINRMSEAPTMEGQPPLSEEDQNLVLNVTLPILGGHLLMGTDAAESMGFKLVQGNNMHINLDPDTKEEAQRLFTELSAGGTVSMPLQEMFWGDFFGSLIDRFGTYWMINYTAK